ncbi:MAG: diguanylate cyclase [Magnetococcales bacterium]|nr:diguanylate cyclase [Magnetococcales bacterium]
MNRRTLLDPGQALAEAAVLYVEDDKLVREQMSLFLRPRVGRLLVAENGADALARFQEERADIVVSDILMPVMDGLALVRALRALDPDLPVVVLTAYNEENYLLQSIELGIDRYLLKPVDVSALMNVLERLAVALNQRRAQERADRFTRMLLEIHPGLLLVVRNDRIVYMNQALLQCLGVESLEEAERRSGELARRFLDGAFQPVIRPEEAREWGKRLLEVCRHQPLIYLRRADQPDLPLVVNHNATTEADCQVLALADVTSLERKLRDLEQLAFTDSLTKAANRVMGRRVLISEMERSRRYWRPFSLISFDVDHFKRVNDTFGHPVGDRVLQEISALCRKEVRAADLLTRWGGEEFLLLCPETSGLQAKEMAEKLRVVVAEHDFGEVKRITCSFGVAMYHADEGEEGLLSRVDKALYQAKETGRNRVVMAEWSG